MKKLVVTSFFIFACIAAQALPIGNPSEPALMTNGWLFDTSCCEEECCDSWNFCEIVNFRLGFYGDYVFNRYLQSADKRRKEDIEKTEKFTNAGYLALNLCNRADLFATLGATNFRLHGFPNVLTNTPSFAHAGLDIKTRTDFSWSLGARAVVWECGSWALGVEGEYFQAKPTIIRFTFVDELSDYPHNAPFNYREGQFGAALSYRFCSLIPYIGVKWSVLRVKCRNHIVVSTGGTTPDTIILDLPDLQNSKSFGFAVGLTLVECDMISFTAEGRFFDEKAIYINGQIRF